MAKTASKQSLLSLLIFSQFAGTSLWFVGNAVVDLLPAKAVGGYALLTSAVQLGFIAGTLVFSVFGLADRYASSRVFFASSVFAAAANALLLLLAHSITAVVAIRFSTGFFLAGIYPVGMKLAADFFPERLGKALGFLVGALVLGTAFPHLLRSQNGVINWKAVVSFTSLLAVGGGLIVLLVFPKRKPIAAKQSRLRQAFSSFRLPNFREAAFGYFGHMWELYAFWAVLPVLLTAYNTFHQTALPVYFFSFAVIAAGAAGCAVGGLLSLVLTSKRIAFYALVLSGVCCLLSPFAFQSSPGVFLSLLFVWGVSVTADSPQFSALVARFADAENKGTALSLVTCIGFAITVLSIYLLKSLFQQYGPQSLWLLSAGPLFGLLALKRPT